MRVVRTIASVVLAIGAAASTAPAASAAGAGTTPQTPWHRYHQQDFTVKAGQGCSFKVAVKVMYDREYYRNLSTYPNGDPHVQLWRGPLILRYTNVGSGKAVVRNVSGVALESFNRDGSFHAIRVISGHFSATLGPGSDPEAGIFFVGGQGSRLVVGDDGVEHLELAKHGRADNLCDPLSS